MHIFGGVPSCACTRTQACGATPELRRVCRRQHYDGERTCCVYPWPLPLAVACCALCRVNYLLCIDNICVYVCVLLAVPP